MLVTGILSNALRILAFCRVGGSSGFPPLEKFEHQQTLHKKKLDKHRQRQRFHEVQELVDDVWNMNKQSSNFGTFQSWFSLP
eukprot:CCRYP_013290-RA/>CCRYP_013290-RA protein AED:0.40 eAED:0.40 QI:36/0/0.5/1/0/0/2/158/81